MRLDFPEITTPKTKWTRCYYIIRVWCSTYNICNLLIQNGVCGIIILFFVRNITNFVLGFLHIRNDVVHNICNHERKNDSKQTLIFSNNLVYDLTPMVDINASH